MNCELNLSRRRNLANENYRNSIYFDTFHKTMPLMHKYRYYASLDRAPHMRPPVCLRYAMWTMAASISEKYNWFEDVLYERTRRYLQQDEMKVNFNHM